MPYIAGVINRRELDPVFNKVATTTGELNYQLTRLLMAYLDNKGESYSTYNDISGAMNECMAEFRRRKIVPYEDKAIDKNGDIWYNEE